MVPLTTRPISHTEARDAVQRLVNSHFNNPEPCEHGRFSIPANVERDDDLVLMAYIQQQEEKQSAARAA